MFTIPATSRHACIWPTIPGYHVRADILVKNHIATLQRRLEAEQP